MVNKRKLHHWLKVIRRLKIWQLVILLIMVSFASAYLLRQNNLGMVERRDAVKKVDQEGGDVKPAMAELQNYVSAHMNTSLGEKGFYLEGSYQRAYDAAITAAAGSTNPNSAVYQQASIECRARFRGGVASFRNDYVTCVAERVGSLSGANDPMAGFQTPDPALFRYNFVSPAWSFDAAGISVAIMLLLLVVITAKIAFSYIAKLLLKRRLH